MVEDIAGKLDKKAELKISGEDIFLENQKLDLIFDQTEGLPRATDVALAANFQLRTELVNEEVVPIYLRAADASPSVH